MLRLLILTACGMSVFADVGLMVVLKKYNSQGTEDDASAATSGQCGDSASSTGACDADDATTNTKTECEAVNAACAWTPFCQQVASMTVLKWETPDANIVTTNVVVNKAFPIADATATTPDNGVYWKTGNAGMYGVGLPFADGTASTNVKGTNTASPIYGIFTVSSGSAPNLTMDLTVWSAVPTGNASPAAAPATKDAAITGVWECQKVRTTNQIIDTNQNYSLSTGIAAAQSGLATISGAWVKIEEYAATDCSGSAKTAILGGLAYEKVAADAGQGLGNQTSCVQSAAATSYSFTLLAGEIVYTTYAGSATCGGTAATGIVFTQAVPCATVGSKGWKIVATKAEWDAVASFEHGSATSNAVAVQVQSTADHSIGTTAADITDQVSNKLFPISTSTDSNFTGQFTSADYKLENMGAPFGTKMGDQLIGATVSENPVYLMFGQDANSDVTLSFFEFIANTVGVPPSQAFVPGAATKWTSIAANMTTLGAVETDALQDESSLASGAGWQNSGGSNGYFTAGFAVDKTRNAVVTGLKYVTLYEVTDCAATPKVYTKGTAATTHASGSPFYYRRSYEFVAASAPTTLRTGCINKTQSISYAFTCAAATQSIVYTTYALKDCGGTGTVAATFTKAARCQDHDGTGSAKMWEIQNSDSDWDDICTLVPAQASASASASASGAGATSDAAVAATAAALAAGAAALIL